MNGRISPEQKKDDEDHQKKKKEMPGLGAKPLWSPLPCDHNHAGSWEATYFWFKTFQFAEFLSITERK